MARHPRRGKYYEYRNMSRDPSQGLCDAARDPSHGLLDMARDPSQGSCDVAREPIHGLFDSIISIIWMRTYNALVDQMKWSSQSPNLKTC